MDSLEKCIICVSLDDDGHFQAAKIDDREEVLFLLKTISFGQFYEDLCYDNYLKEIEIEDAQLMDNEEWMDYLKKFEKKKQFEILSV